MLFLFQPALEMAIVPVNKANVCTTVFIIVRVCLLKFKTRKPRLPCIAHLHTSQVSSQLAFRFKRRSSKQIFDWNDVSYPYFTNYPIRPTRCLVNCHLVQEKKFKKELQEGSHLGFRIEMILTVFD